MHESKGRRAVFRCDGGVKIGAGHLARCLTLANGLYLEGWGCTFMVNEEAERVLPRLLSSDHSVCFLESDQLLSANVVMALGGDLLVVDNYELGASFETECKDGFRLVMAIEDLSNRGHQCDILLNQNANLGSTAAVEGGVSRCLFGRQYALLDPRFAELRYQALLRRSKVRTAQRLLICFGASDPGNLCGRAARAVLKLDLELSIDIAVSGASPNAEELRTLAQHAGSRVTLHFDASNMPELMADADLAIGAAGVTTWERCCLGVPSLVYQCAENQSQIAKAVSDSKAGFFMGHAEMMDESSLQNAVEWLSRNSAKRAEMGIRASQMSDGMGVARVITAINSEFDGLSES